jgi:carbonic anhydrase/acetyltransferase-like protein (isoleucine patch superfamily)
MLNLEFLDREPSIHPTAFIAPSSDVIGDVTIGEDSSIWYGCVLRADINRIVIGKRSNLQDGSLVHLSDDYGVQIGDDVTIGHKALIHACTIGDGVLVGMGATIMDGAVIGAGSIVGAGSLVLAGTTVPPGSLVLGSPAKVVRELDVEERDEGRRLAAKYILVSRRYQSLP